MLLALACLLVLAPGAHASSKGLSDIVKEANASAHAAQQDAKRLIDQIKNNTASHDMTRLMKGSEGVSIPKKNEKKPFNGFGMPFLETQDQGCSSCQVTKHEEERPSSQETQISQTPHPVSFSQERPEGPSDDYIVCVSFSLPDASLKPLLEHAAKRNVRVVVRGLIENSWVKTTKRMGDIGLPLDIDPEIFEKYAVTHVPTFIRVTSSGHHKLQGNVSLSFALSKLDAA